MERHVKACLGAGLEIECPRCGEYVEEWDIILNHFDEPMMCWKCYDKLDYNTRQYLEDEGLVSI